MKINAKNSVMNKKSEFSINTGSVLLIFPLVSGSSMAWQGAVTDPVYLKFWYFVHHEFLH